MTTPSSNQQNQSSFRSGLGYDIHRLEAGDNIVLGGHNIPCDYKLIAYSDGDVVLHAICDALLGAVAAGDLGEHFPDTDPHHRNRASQEFVHHILALPQLANWEIVNIDLNIIAQTPRLSAHKKNIRESIARICAITLDQISVKARSKEGLGPVGNCEAIEAQAIVLLQSTQGHPQ